MIAVAAVGRAEGSRAAAAALACAGADVDRATLLIDVGGRPPRPTLLASAVAQRLEERLAAHLPGARIAARGQICQLAVAAEPEGFEAASAALTVARDSLAVLHLPAARLQDALAGFGSCPGPSGVLLRAEIGRDRALLALAVRDLLDRDLAVGVLKQRLGWVVERRALFGALAANAPGGLPPGLLVVSCRMGATLTLMTRKLTQRELRNQSGEIMRELDRGEDFIVTRNGVPVGELRPVVRRQFVPTKVLQAALQGVEPEDPARFRADVDAILDQDPTPRAWRED